MNEVTDVTQALRFPGKPRVIVTCWLMPAVAARMRELFDVRLNTNDELLDGAALVAATSELRTEKVSVFLTL